MDSAAEAHGYTTAFYRAGAIFVGAICASGLLRSQARPSPAAARA
jgi:hypothetical protein